MPVVWRFSVSDRLSPTKYLASGSCSFGSGSARTTAKSGHPTDSHSRQRRIAKAPYPPRQAEWGSSKIANAFSRVAVSHCRNFLQTPTASRRSPRTLWGFYTSPKHLNLPVYFEVFLIPAAPVSTEPRKLPPLIDIPDHDSVSVHDLISAAIIPTTLQSQRFQRSSAFSAV